MNLFKSCVSKMNVYNAIQRTVISVSVHRLLPTLHQLQLFDLVCCPLRGKIVSEQYDMSCDVPAAAPHLLCRWCSTHLAAILHIFKSHHNIQSNTNPEIFACSANSFTVQCLSYPHTIIMATDTSEWTDTEGQPWRMSTDDTHPPMNACSHHETVWYGMAQSPSASCRSAWHSHAFMTWRTAIFTYIPPLYRLPFQNEINITITLACEVYVHSYIYTYHSHRHTHTHIYAQMCKHTHNLIRNIYKYIPCAFKCIYTRPLFYTSLL